jgi:hypothetical protein
MTLTARFKPSPDSLDPVSRSLLPVLRHLLQSLQCSGSDGWQTAYATAAEVWGEGRGLAIAFRSQRFLAALLRSRPGPLRHADALCPDARRTLTDDECILLALLAHMRDDEAAAARDMLAALTGGRIEASVVRTGLELCGLLGGTGAASRGRRKPRLEVVR